MIFGIGAGLYFVVLNIVLMIISGSLRDELKGLGIAVEANPNDGRVVYRNFWNKIRGIYAMNPLPSIRKALRKKTLLYVFGALLVALFFGSRLLNV